MPLFTQRQLENHIGSGTIFRRGKGYANGNRIRQMELSQKNEDILKIDAEIQGSGQYFTEISFHQKTGEIEDSDCDCPYYTTCKHISALGLYAIKQHQKGEFLIPAEQPLDIFSENIIHPPHLTEKNTYTNDDIFSLFELEKNDSSFQTKEVPQEKPEFELQIENGNLVLLHKKGNQPFDFSHESEKNQIFWDMFFALFPPQTQKFPVSSKLLSKIFPVLEHSQSIFLNSKLPDSERRPTATNGKKRYSFIRLKEKQTPLHFSISTYQDNILMSLKKGKLLLGEHQEWIVEENIFSPVLPGVPRPLLNIFAKGPWKIPQMEGEKILSNVIPFLENKGHVVELKDNIQPPNIYTKPEVHFLLTKKEKSGVHYLQIHGEFRIPKEAQHLTPKTKTQQENFQSVQKNHLDKGNSEDFKNKIPLDHPLKKGKQEDEETSSLSKEEALDTCHHLSFLEIIHESLDDNYFFRPYYTYRKATSKKLQRKGSKILASLGNNEYLYWDEKLIREIISEIFQGDMQGSFDEERTKDALLVEYGSERFFQFIRRFQKLKNKKPDWHIHKSKGLENLSLKKKEAKIDFDFSLHEESGLFSFDWEAKLDKQNISLEKLQKMFQEYDRYYEGENGEFFEMKNKHDLEELLKLTEKFQKDGKGRHQGNMYHIPEVLHFVDEKARIKKQCDAFSSFLQEVKKGKPLKNVPIPKETKNILRSYQKNGIDWGHFLRKYRFGGILADDMGLGKTLQALTLLASVKSKSSSLIVCPKTLIYNWTQEIEKFFPKKKVLPIDGKTAERKKILESKEIQKADILITSYPLLQRDVEQYQKFTNPFEYMILDEAQHIKNHKTKTAQVVKAVDAKYRLALTGTALENGVADIWSIFDFLMPGFLGKYEQFRQEYENPIQKQNSQHSLKRLTSKIKPFMLRRTKEKVLKDLPPKIEQNVFCELSKDQLVLYTQTLTQVKKEIFHAVEKKGFERSRIEILAALTRLRQICNHPRTVVPTKKNTQSGKFDLFFELLEEVQESKKKVLVFSSFVKTLKLLKEELENKKIDYSYLDGSTNNRPKVISEFENDPEKTCFLISMKAGGTGLNLTCADTVFLFDPWWNPMVEMQAMDRAHRIGQKNTVNVYSLLTKGTLEEKMLTIKDRKKKLFESVVGENEEFLQKLTWGDIEGLFEL